MERQRLIFFASQDPDVSTHPTWSAYHFGLVAHRAGLDAEVRLAGSAVLALREAWAPDSSHATELRAKMQEAVEADLFVSG